MLAFRGALLPPFLPLPLRVSLFLRQIGLGLRAPVRCRDSGLRGPPLLLQGPLLIRAGGLCVGLEGRRESSASQLLSWRSWLASLLLGSVLPKTGLGANWKQDGKYRHAGVLGGELSGIRSPPLPAFSMKSSLAVPSVPLGVMLVGPRYSGGRFVWPLPSAPKALGPGLLLGEVRLGLWTRVGCSPWRSAMGFPRGVSLAPRLI